MLTLTDQTERRPPTPADPINYAEIFARIRKFFDYGGEYRIARWLFLRALGLIYLGAFLSFYVQVRGLIGKRGIAPIADFLPRVQVAYPGAERFLRFPTLAWINSSDTFLGVMCLAGAVCGLLVVLRIAPIPMLMAAWMLYLSLVTAGGVFMTFQWDILLLEAGFLAIFLAPLNLRPSRIDKYSTPLFTIWLYRWLLFRLMFASGAVKLLSNDPTWQNLSAMHYHYETQPLPTPLAWLMHQLPDWFHNVETGMVFVVELMVPFLFFAPRKARYVGGIVTIVFQIGILLTGNYTFFNWLTIAMCLLLFDDRFWARLTPRWLAAGLNEPLAPPRIQRAVILVAGIVLFILSGVRFRSQMLQTPVPEIFSRPLEETNALRLTSTYGLFAVMTTTRPQLIIEGSRDGEIWQAYAFKYQVQDVKKMPPIVAPHQPRLDWQMWFAALGTYRQNPWLVNLLYRLLQGVPEVEALFAYNPFPDEPPQFIRVETYDYHFSDFKTHAETGAWWTRQFMGDYIPSISLANFEG